MTIRIRRLGRGDVSSYVQHRELLDDPHAICLSLLAPLRFAALSCSQSARFARRLTACPNVPRPRMSGAATDFATN